MLTEKEIQKALHANRVVTLPTTNPHGPLGLEHLAHIVTQIQASSTMRPVEVPLETWLKLEHLAEVAAKTAARPVSVSELATAILQNFVATNP
jgi:hypothetical protein